MSSSRARLIEEGGCHIKVVHLDSVEQARKDAIADPALDRLALVVHLGQRAEDGLVPQVVEDFVAAFEFLDAFAHAFVGRKQHAAEHALFGLRRMRRQTVHGAAGIGTSRFLAAGTF